jgi:uncharacterized protein (TIGR00369 family)
MSPTHSDSAQSPRAANRRLQKRCHPRADRSQEANSELGTMGGSKSRPAEEARRLCKQDMRVEEGMAMDVKNSSRTISWTDPAKLAEIAGTMSGLDYMRSVRDGAVEEPPVARLLGYHVVEVEEGRVVFEMTPSEYHYNPFGTVHGGVASSILDATTGATVYTTLPVGMSHASLDLKVNFVRPITLRVGRMRCDGKIVHRGRRTAIAEAKLTDINGELYAVGSSICMIFG